MDWHELLRIDVSPLELFVRGSAMYWLLFCVFRFVLRRDVGAVGTADILLLVLIADASQNAMSGGYTSVAEGVVLVATLIGWNYLLDWLAFRFERIERLIEPPPLVLVRRGRILWRNMRREHITRDDLLGHLRQHGLTALAQVRLACMESDGKVSVVPVSGTGSAEDSGVPGAG